MTPDHKRWREKMLPAWQAYSKDVFGRNYEELGMWERAAVLAGTR